MCCVSTKVGNGLKPFPTMDKKTANTLIYYVLAVLYGYTRGILAQRKDAPCQCLLLMWQVGNGKNGYPCFQLSVFSCSFAFCPPSANRRRRMADLTFDFLFPVKSLILNLPQAPPPKFPSSYRSLYTYTLRPLEKIFSSSLWKWVSK